MKRYSFVFILILILVLVNSVIVSSKKINEPFSTRSKAMGGIATAFLDEAAAMTANPATLTQLKGLSVVGEGFWPLNKLEEKQSIFDYIFNKADFSSEEVFLQKASGFMGFSSNRFGLGLIASIFVDNKAHCLEVVKQTTSNVALALPLGVFTKILDNVFMGINIKLRNAKITTIDKELSCERLATGTGGGLDVGILLDFQRIKVGLSVNDTFSDLDFDDDLHSMTIRPYGNLGLFWDFNYKNNPGTTLMGIDFTEVSIDSSGIRGKIRIGIEQKVFKILKLRAGIAKGDFWKPGKEIEYSFGFGADLGPSRFDFAISMADQQRNDIEGSIGLSLRI